MKFSFKNKPLFKVLSQKDYLLETFPNLWADRIFLQDEEKTNNFLKNQQESNGDSCNDLP